MTVTSQQLKHQLLTREARIYSVTNAVDDHMLSFFTVQISIIKILSAGQVGLFVQICTSQARCKEDAVWILLALVALLDQQIGRSDRQFAWRLMALP